MVAGRGIEAMGVEVSGDLLTGLRGERVAEGWPRSQQWLGTARGGGCGSGKRGGSGG